MSENQPVAPFVFGTDCFDALTAQAQASTRARKNLNFHATPAHPSQRLLNAVEPASYVQPHRHVGAMRDETLIALRGAFGILLFDERGNVAAKAVIRAGGEQVGANIPAGVFHSLIALETGSVFIEAGAGPYDPVAAKELAPWAPAEGSEGASAYHARLRALL